MGGTSVIRTDFDRERESHERTRLTTTEFALTRLRTAATLAAGLNASPIALHNVVATAIEQADLLMDKCGVWSWARREDEE